MRARLVTRQVPAPAADTAITFRPSPTDRTRIQSLVTTLVTGEAIGSRYVYLELRDDNGLAYYASQFVIGQSAEGTVSYCWAEGAPLITPSEAPTGAKLSAPFPEVWLAPSDTIVISARELKALDVFGVTTLRYLIGENWEHLQEEQLVDQALGV